MVANGTGHTGSPGDGFFEGTEKLLEIWFSGEQAKDAGLRKVPKSEWVRMLTAVKCTIISEQQSESIDSYVLSESSMFVSAQRIILKTCGTTGLLWAVPILLDIAKDHCGFTEVVDVFYSRKNFLHPEQQTGPHTSFKEEVNFLDKHFNGSAYILGSINSDVWYLYTLSKPEPVPQPDQTLEVLMTDLDQDALQLFYKDKRNLTSEQITEQSGINTLVPECRTHAMIFDPCGYSVNGLLKDTYFTIHITPQPGCSYVSFETNHTVTTYDPMVEQLLQIFRPRKILMTIFANETATCGSASSAVSDALLERLGFERGHEMGIALKHYGLWFSDWSKPSPT